MDHPQGDQRMGLDDRMVCRIQSEDEIGDSIRAVATEFPNHHGILIPRHEVRGGLQLLNIRRERLLPNFDDGGLGTPSVIPRGRQIGVAA